MWEKLKKEFEQGKTLLGFSFLQVSGYVATMLIPLVVAKLFPKNPFGKYSLSEMIIFFFATCSLLLPAFLSFTTPIGSESRREEFASRSRFNLFSWERVLYFSQ
jgi:hypothetical protein